MVIVISLLGKLGVQGSCVIYPRSPIMKIRYKPGQLDVKLLTLNTLFPSPKLH